MAPRRKQRTGPPQGRELKIRLPGDVADRIESKARDEARPQNRIIINELASYPRLEKIGDLAQYVSQLEVLLIKYSERITWLELSEHLLNAVDALLTAEGGAREAALDKLRVVRKAMLKTAKGPS